MPENLLHIVPLFLAFIVAIVLAMVLWQRQHIHSVRWFVLYLLAQALWVLAYGLEQFTPTVDLRLILNTLQWWLGIVMGSAWVLFALAFTRMPLSPVLAVLSIPLIVFPLLVATHPLHGQVYLNPHIVPGMLFDAFAYEQGLFLRLTALYSYALLLAGSIPLLRSLTNRHALYRRQMIFILISVALPSILSLFFGVLGIAVHDMRSLYLAAFTAGNALVIYSLLRFRLFDVVPIAREMLIDSFNDAVVVIDDAARLLDLNAIAADAAISQRRESLIGLPLEQVFPQWADVIQHHADADTLLTSATRTGQDGELYYYQIQVTPVRADGGKVIGRLIIVFDVTERRRATDKLQDHILEAETTRQLYDELVHNIPGMTYTYRLNADGTTQFDFVSDRCLELNHLTPEQVYADATLLEHQIDPKYAEIYRRRVEQFRVGRNDLNIIVQKTVEGETYWRRFLATVQKKADGSLLFHGVEFDITDRVRSENAAKEAERRYRLLSDVAFEALVVHREGIAIDVNRAFTRMFGYSRDEVLGENLVELLFTPETRQIVWEHTPLKYARTYEVVCQHKDGHTFPVEIESQMLNEDEGVRVAALRDVTLRRQHEQHRLELGLERQRVRVLTDFVQYAAHEFRNPLASITTSVYLMQRLKDPERRAQKVQHINHAVQDITRILENMLELVRLDEPQMAHLMPLQINQIIEAVSEHAGNSIQDRGHRLTHDLAADLPMVQGSADQIYSALLNLLQNAIQYTPDGGTIHLRSWLENGAGNDTVYVEVQDSGIGMSAAEQERVFDRFYRADEARSTRGFGLGLTIVKRIMEMHNAHIEIESAPGAGSCIRLAFPVSTARVSDHE